MATEPSSTPLLSRVLAWAVFVVMALALAYTAWIALSNFSRIGV